MFKKTIVMIVVCALLFMCIQVSAQPIIKTTHLSIESMQINYGGLSFSCILMLSGYAAAWGTAITATALSAGAAAWTILGLYAASAGIGIMFQECFG